MDRREPSRLKRKTVFSGRSFDVQSETWREASGNTFIRESVVHPGAVAILPYAAADRLVMIRSGYRNNTVDSTTEVIEPICIDPHRATLLQTAQLNTACSMARWASPFFT